MELFNIPMNTKDLNNYGELNTSIKTTGDIKLSPGRFSNMLTVGASLLGVTSMELETSFYLRSHVTISFFGKAVSSGYIFTLKDATNHIVAQARCINNMIALILSDGSLYGTGVNISDWHHISISFTSEKIFIIVDGELSKTKTVILSPINSKCKLTLFDNGFTGYIGELRVFNHNISYKELRDIYLAKYIHIPFINTQIATGEDKYRLNISDLHTIYDITTISPIEVAYFEDKINDVATVLPKTNKLTVINCNSGESYINYPASFSFWVKPENINDDQDRLIFSYPAYYLRLYIKKNMISGTYDYYLVYDDGIVSQNSIVKSGILIDHFAMISVTISSTEIRCYYNGEYSNKALVSTKRNTTNDIYINNIAEPTLNINIYDLRCYAAKLSIHDIESMYRSNSKALTLQEFGSIDRVEYLDSLVPLLRKHLPDTSENPESYAIFEVSTKLDIPLTYPIAYSINYITDCTIDINYSDGTNTVINQSQPNGISDITKTVVSISINPGTLYIYLDSTITRLTSKTCGLKYNSILSYSQQIADNIFLGYSLTRYNIGKHYTISGINRSFPLKYYGAGWYVLFKHDIISPESIPVNQMFQGSNDTYLSTFGALEQFRKSNGNFRFRLLYKGTPLPGVILNTQYNEWEQSSHPLLESVSGFNAIHCDWPDYFEGLEPSDDTSCYIRSSLSTSENRLFEIGLREQGSGYNGPVRSKVFTEQDTTLFKSVLLLVKFDR